ncbi:LTA synthase family protein [Pedobacter boryungensis]|uniref:Sulfatase-like hydrolase/transferase n=2 Tax=Pseudomonadati TaxID=3379134 RepID=A0ABX2DFR4_9SPHI|nr:alkaline phosphatase family protein [Pedobacter boryungensis]NQX32942.1 sulfatase-like hydrolase/transferase [Pedobacter boryungensis]
MKNKTIHSYNLIRVYQASQAFAKVMIVWLGILFLLSVLELILNGITRQIPPRLFAVLGWSWLMDIIFWLKWIWLEYLIFVLIYFYSQKAAYAISYIVLTVLAIAQLVLMGYFNTSLVPLGGDLYGYSIADIKQTIGASGGLSIGISIGFLVVVVGVIIAFRFLPKKVNVNSKVGMSLPILSFLLLFIPINSYIGLPNLDSDFSNNLVINKSDYFFSASYDHFFPQSEEVDIYADNYIGDYENGNTTTVASFNYLDENEYPFLHTDETPDVLTPFLKPNAKPPHIVILLVEGLGRAFTNEGAYLGNFTPFIDSLSGKSLYWKNFLSEGGRTFAVLPSLIGSLPFAKNGFLEMGNQMPNHLSLYSLLKHNGYHTSFYYGGDSKFDNMNAFLKKNAVDEINDEFTFPNGYQKLPAHNGFTWGYTDDQLFNYYLNTRKAEVEKAPELNVILTVATHNPFFINNQDKYLKLFEQRMDQLKFDDSKKSDYRNYKLQYSSIMYTDESLRNFFAKYQKRSDYANTIFFITGDHRMPEIPMSNKIDRYHVPLIIYSPMLKRTAQMESISTHFDITPSILAYLKKNFAIKTPAVVSWLGQGLDTARNFRNVHSYPMIQTKTDMLDFVMGEYHLNGNTLFKLNNAMEEVSIQDEAAYNQLKNAFDNFKKKNSKIANGGKIVPDSLIKKYSPLIK